MTKLTASESNLAIVLACIKRLCDSSDKNVALYSDIVDESDISPHIVKEKVEQLVRDQEVARVSRGVYQAIKVFAPPRPISKTVLADGEVVLEIGDDVVHLTPQEERLMRGMFGSAPVEIHQPPPQAQAAQPVEPSPVMQITEIACLYRVPVRFARQNIVTAQGFPSPIPGSSQRKKLWPRHAVEHHAKSANVH